MVAAPDPPAGRAWAEEAFALATENGNQITGCHALAQLTGVSVMQGRLVAAGKTAADALQTAERIGDSTFTTVLRFMLAWRAALQRDDEAAAANARTAMEVAAASGNPVDRGFVSYATGLRCYANGELDQARTTLAEALPTMTVFAGGLFAPHIAEMLADVALNVGNVAAAREHGMRAAEYADQTQNNWGRSRAALAQCRLDLHAGEVLAAAETADRALKLAQGNEDALTTVDALELIAHIALRRRKPDNAARLLGAAAAERGRLGYARAHLRDIEHASSIAQLKQRLGADDAAEAWAQGEQLKLDDAIALARSRRGSRERPAIGWDSLTPAELRVVELVGEGLNNVQIAEKLFVTRDTVKGHVAHAFGKLGVTNRVELAALAVRRATR